MKRTLLYIFIAFAAIGGLYSCKNKLEVFAPGEESVSVYGILNPSETTQNIRINKVYLTDGDALVAGQDASQINYGAGELEVSLERFLTGSTTPTLTTVGNTTRKKITLTETVVTTQSGSFSQEQRIWQTSDKLFTDGDYKISIKNIKTGKTWNSQTSSLDSIKSGFFPLVKAPAYPTHGHYPFTPTNNDQNKYLNYYDVSKTTELKFNSVKNARVYSLNIRFHYKDSTSTGIDSSKFVDFILPEIKSTKLDGTELMSFKFSNAEFYTNIGSKLSQIQTPANLIHRRSNYIEFIVYAGSEVLNDFISVNAPSNTIAQDKPLFSNITGGVGVFACKSKYSITRDLWDQFINEIACNPATKPHLFIKYDKTLCL